MNQLSQELRILCNHPLFNNVPPDTIAKTTKAFPRINLDAETVIMEQGEKGDHAYILLEGKVEVYSLSLNNQKTTIIFHQAPFLFGEFEIWEQRPYLAYVRSLTKVQLLKMTKASFLTLLHSNHQLAINLVKILSDLFYETGQDRRVKMFGKVENLLANTLASFAELYGETTPEGTILIKKKINKSEIASILGFSRKSVIEGIKLLENEKLIMVENTHIVIPNIELLRQKARYL